MATVVSSHAGLAVRGARPEAILVVLIVTVALFVYLSGSRTKNKGGEGISRVGLASHQWNGADGDLEPARRDSDRKEGKPRNASVNAGNAETGEEEDVAGDTEGQSRRRHRKKTEQARADAMISEKGKEEQEEKERLKAEVAKKKARKEKEAKEKAEQKEEKAAREKLEAEETVQLEAARRADEDSAPPTPALSDRLYKRDAKRRPERPSGRDSPVLLKRDAGGRWTRPPLSGKQGVRFDDGGKQGKEAKSMVTFNGEDPTDWLYEQSHTDLLKNHVSIQRGRDSDRPEGKVDGSETPIKRLIERGELSDKLIALMRRAEWHCLVDLLHSKTSREVKRAAAADQWIPGIGPIPSMICDVVQQIIAEKKIHLPRLMLAMALPHPQIDKDAERKRTGHIESFLGYLQGAGFQVKAAIEGLQIRAWKNSPLADCQKAVMQWTADQLEARPESKEFQLVLGLFVPYYRATASYSPAHIKKSMPVGWEAQVGLTASHLVEWLRYIGKAFIISRMFSSTGADLGQDLSMRLTMSHSRGYLGFVAEYTLFLPSVKGDDLSPLSSVINPQEEAVLKRSRYLVSRWVEHLADNVYKRADGQSFFTEISLIQYVQMCFRPGIPLSELDPEVVAAQMQGRSAPRARPDAALVAQPVNMDVKLETLNQLWKSDLGSHLAEQFARFYRLVNAGSIRFVNQRQYHWYNPTNTSEAIIEGERFNQATFRAMLMVSMFLSKHSIGSTFAYKSDRIRRDEPESNMDFELALGYGSLKSIDFGGLIPIELDRLKSPLPRFLDMSGCRGLTSVILPFVSFEPTHSNDPSQPSSAAFVLRKQWGLFEPLYGRGGTDFGVTFHGPSPTGRQALVDQLAMVLSEETGRWVQDARAENVRNKLDMVVHMIRTRVKYITIAGEGRKDDSERSELSEFELPRQLAAESQG
ncbi:hypothetical protein IAU60_002000 [Kwoniella sp. DSM 27419]